MLVIKAIEFAAKKHKGQERRGSGLPYIVHPVAVMHLISKYKRDSKHWAELQCAALLHDTLEDTECTYTELEREFGPLVASIVMELTSDEEMIKQMGKNEYLIDKMLKMSKYAFILKLVDRLANVSDQPREKYVHNTIVMMETLLEKREDLTNTQRTIINEISRVCSNYINNKGK